MSKQLLRCGTSIGANLSESVYAQSEDDFVHKYSIALKETSETQYWLELLFKTQYLNEKEFNSMFDECVEINKLLTSSIKTIKTKKI